MSFWEIFWLSSVLFSLISFLYMSIKVLYHGISELKYMFKTLDEEELNNDQEKIGIKG
jgi:hypothetical protein